MPVGVITHKAIEKELADLIRSWQFKTVRSMHFGNLRGSNDFGKSKILIVLGCPIPNLTGFKEECQAFFYDDRRPLNFHKNNAALVLKMRDGRRFPVSVYGHWKAAVSSYYKQKCQAELYQALHRIRPYTERRYDRHVFLFTNMPVPGVKVDHVIVDPESWGSQVAQKVEELLTDSEKVTVKELATVVPPRKSKKASSVEKSITNNGDAIAILAGAWHYPGTRGVGGTANRFAKNPVP